MSQIKSKVLKLSKIILKIQTLVFLLQKKTLDIHADLSGKINYKTKVIY